MQVTQRWRWHAETWWSLATRCLSSRAESGAVGSLRWSDATVRPVCSQSGVNLGVRPKCHDSALIQKQKSVQTVQNVLFLRMIKMLLLLSKSQIIQIIIQNPIIQIIIQKQKSVQTLQNVLFPQMIKMLLFGSLLCTKCASQFPSNT